MMSKRILLLVLVVLLSVSTSAFADERVKKMQFIVTSPDAQTQMMAMVLSMQSMKKGCRCKYCSLWPRRRYRC